MNGAARAVPSGVVARGRLTVPPSKSVTHRYLALALVAGTPLRLRRPLVAEDTGHFFEVLRQVGRRVETGDDGVRIGERRRDVAAAELWCGKAGTLARLLVAALTTVPGRWVVDGAARLRERPMGPLVAALRELGAGVEELGAPGRLPLRIAGGSLAGGEATLDAGESSQYLSALMIAGLAAPAPSLVRLVALTSEPYVAVTEAVIRRWGGAVRRRGDVVEIAPGLLSPGEATVDGDDSAAAYLATAAALTGGRVELDGLARESAQGDRGFVELLGAMGATVEWRGGRLVVAGDGGLVSTGTVDLSSMPDQVPTLAALAPFAAGTTEIVGVPHLRLKESDRLRAMAVELGRLGVAVEERPDGLRIGGCWASTAPPGTPVEVASWDDHRIAMSLALVGLRRPGVSVAEPGVVAKSYPGFWDDLEALVR